ncbi:unnamed protein product [Didymodactylos carnosus]|uniref:Uncharacterized protein n=1 Tax=Didymodactylos carnosus TaxID=1234261 RepID=A0A813TEK6_9BILA|nr:unnamed protein product [Didymodactylos carnosus]CAF3597162.1 unnamed protein product [Didymodactylos carnosus]
MKWKLQAENTSLRQELAALRQILTLPTSLNDEFDQKRYIQLRNQIYTLEKQVCLMTKLLDSKRQAVVTCETILIELGEFLRNLLSNERTMKGYILVNETDLQMWCEKVENSQKKSFKSLQDHVNMDDTLYASTAFSRTENIHLLDVCSGKIDHLNLKEIALLESSLLSLHSNLQQFSIELEQQQRQSLSNDDNLSLFLFPDLNERTYLNVKKLSQEMTNVSNQLFDLSLLIPARPPTLSKSPCIISSEITTDVIWKRLASYKFSPNIKIILKSIFDSLIAAFNHKYSGLQLKTETKEKELEFYRHITKIHYTHVQTVLKVITCGQMYFNEQLKNTLYEPLNNIMNEYHKMSKQPTENCLRTFLFTFKIHVDQFEETLHDLEELVKNGVKASEQLFIETNDTMITEIKRSQQNLLKEFHRLNEKQAKISMASEKSLDDLFDTLNISSNFPLSHDEK